MGRNSKRNLTSMFSEAITAYEGETVAQLKEEIEKLKSQTKTDSYLFVKDIVPLQLPGSMKQPRLYFDPMKMERLKNSIDKHGVLEPILVRPGKKGKYQIISGERRWRCCVDLGKDDIPCVVREMSDEIALEAALIAHLLNEDISPIEQTESILSLLALRLSQTVESVKGSLYQVKNSRVRGSENSRIFTEEELKLVEEILNEFGMKLSSFVSNRLPMLNLAPYILDAVREGKLSPTNAVIINRQPNELQERLISEAEGLTKQELLNLVKQPQNGAVKLNERQHVVDRVFDKIKLVRKKKALREVPAVQTRLKKIEKLLKEIEKIEN